MLTIPGRWNVRNCDGVSRRDFMQVGSLGLLGMTLSQVFVAAGASERGRGAAAL